MRAREAISTRSVAAWCRAYQQRSAWTMHLSRAAAWIRRDGRVCLEWLGPALFGTGLEECVGKWATAGARVADRASTGRSTGLPQWLKPIADQGNTTRDRSSGRTRSQTEIHNAPQPRDKRAYNPISHQSPLSLPQALINTSSRVSRSQLTRLAGGTGSAPALAEVRRIQRSVPDSRTRKARTGLLPISNATEARAMLGSHLQARVTRSVIRASGRSAAADSRIRLGASQLSKTIAPGTPGLVLERETHTRVLVEGNRSPATTTPSGLPQPHPAGSGRSSLVPGVQHAEFTGATRSGADEPHSSGPVSVSATAVVPDTASSHPTDEFALEEIVRRQAGSILTSHIGTRQVRTSFTDTPAALQRRESLGAQAAESANNLQRGAAPHAAFDRIEFAEHLRTALIDDARRHGIEI